MRQSISLPVRPERGVARRVVRFPLGYSWWNLLGPLLIVAAALKFGFRYEKNVNIIDKFDLTKVYIVFILLEFFLGSWLIAGCCNRQTKKLVEITFAIFCVAALILGLMGETSCGCFGNIKISPWYTFVFDSGILTAILLTRDKPVPYLGICNVLIRAGIAGAVAMTIGLVLLSFSPAWVTVSLWRGSSVGGDTVSSLRPNS